MNDEQRAQLKTAIQEKIQLPVFDIYTLVQIVHQAVVRERFSGYM